MKLTYAEQLKHPNWQRLRLQVLEAAEWRCQCCEAGDRTLHVHHKQYTKGRLAWDYAIENFEALCEGCHKDAHDAKERINNVLAQLPSYMWERAASVLAGFSYESIDTETRQSVPDTAGYLAGQLAFHMGNYDGAEQVMEICDCFTSLGPTDFLETLRGRVRETFEE